MTAVLEAAQRGAALPTPPDPRPDGRRTSRWRSVGGWFSRHGESLGLFVLLYGLYVAFGAVLLFHYGSSAHDAVSRVDDASEVVFSSDPHLAAVGFVWNPLPSLLEIPLILFKHWWPALLARGFAANLESAAFMAGAALGVRRIVLDRGGGRVARLALPLILGLDPYIAFYGANGMSEAFFVFFLVWTVHALLRYVERGTAGTLVRAGLMLNLAYLCRYEAAAAAMGAVGLVFLIRWRAARGLPRRLRLLSTAPDVALIALPFALAFIGWSALSWAIVGHPFEQFASQYGNDGFIAADHSTIVTATGQGSAAAIPYVLQQMFWLEPLAGIVVVIAIVIALRRRSWFVVVPLMVFAPVLVFEMAAFFKGDTYGWLRFYIMIIPMCVCTVAVVLPLLDVSPGLDPDTALAEGFRRGVVGMCVIGLLLPALWSGTTVFSHRKLAREETSEVYDVLHGNREYKKGYENDARVAAFIDTLHAGRGQVLAEARNTTTVRPVSNRQDIYLDTTDVHFQRDLADPVRFGIKYLLVAEPGPYFDALLNAYPTMWANGAGFGPLIASFPNSSEHFRIYKVTAKVTPGAVG